MKKITVAVRCIYFCF